MIRTTNRLRRWGITKTEVVVVILCCLLLLFLLLPAVQKVRNGDVRAHSMYNLKSMALACHNAASAFNGVTPPAFGRYPPEPQDAPVKFKPPIGSLFYHILPYIEQDNVYNTMKAAGSTTAGNFVVREYVAVLDRTNDGTTSQISYSSNFAVFGTQGARLPQTFGKGLANTIIFAEKSSKADLVPEDFTKPPQSNSLKYTAPPVVFSWTDTVYGVRVAEGKEPFYPYPASITPTCDNPVYSSLDFSLPTTAPQDKTPSQFGASAAESMACSLQGFDPERCHVALGDASARWVKPTMRPATFNWAGNLAGPPAPPSDW